MVAFGVRGACGLVQGVGHTHVHVRWTNWDAWSMRAGRIAFVWHDVGLVASWLREQGFRV